MQRTEVVDLMRHALAMMDYVQSQMDTLPESDSCELSHYWTCAVELGEPLPADL